MSNYTAEKKTLDGVEVVVLRDAARAAEVRVVPSVGNNSYEMTVHGKRVFWSPFETVAQVAARPVHLGNPLLWPWANRIEGLGYWANGKKYALQPELKNFQMSPPNAPIHGLITYSKLWKVTGLGGDQKSAWVTSRLEFWREPELMAQFPFAHVIEMTYRLAEGTLAVETRIENLSSAVMPVSLGYHPYFVLHDAPRDQWKVTLPAEEKFLLSPRLIPTGEKVANPYAQPQGLEGLALDDVFGKLKRDADGYARFVVEGVKESITVEYGPKYTVAVVYAPKGRGFVCFEPMTGPTNAFNAAHDGWYTELQSIQPGGVWTETFRVVPKGF